MRIGEHFEQTKVEITKPEETDALAVQKLYEKAELPIYERLLTNRGMPKRNLRRIMGIMRSKTHEFVEQFISHDPLMFQRVAKANGTVVGYIQGIRGKHFTELETIVIAPEFQGKDRGVSTHLLSDFFTWAQEAPIELTVVDGNKRAQALYTNLGFNEIHRYVGPNGLTHIRMRRENQTRTEHPKEDLTIDTPTPADAQGIVRLIRDSEIALYARLYNFPKETTNALMDAYSDTSAEVRRYTLRLSVEFPSTRRFVARRNGHIVGYIEATKWDRDNRINLVLVAPSEQNSGIGSLLITRALSFLDYTSPNKETTLRVVAGNSQAIAFYEKHGFEKRGEILPLILTDDIEIPSFEMVRKNPASKK